MDDPTEVPRLEEERQTEERDESRYSEDAIMDDVEPLAGRSLDMKERHKRIVWVASLVSIVVATVAAILLSYSMRGRLPGFSGTEGIKVIEGLRKNGAGFAGAHAQANQALERLNQQKLALSELPESDKGSNAQLYLPVLRAASQEARKDLRAEIGALDSLIESLEEEITGYPDTSSPAADERTSFLDELQLVYESARALLEREWEVVEAMKKQFDTVDSSPLTEALRHVAEAREKLAEVFDRFEPTIKAMGKEPAFVTIKSLATTSRFP